MSKVICRVDKVVVQKPYSEGRIEASFPGDLLYGIDVPYNAVTTEDGRTVFDADGMRHIMRELTVVLYFETEENDF